MSASSPSTSSTPCRSATTRSCASASSAPSRSMVTTAARLTDGIGDPPVEVGRSFGVLSVDDVEYELMISLRAGQAGVYDPARLLGEGARRGPPPSPPRRHGGPPGCRGCGARGAGWRLCALGAARMGAVALPGGDCPPRLVPRPGSPGAAPPP